VARAYELTLADLAAELAPRGVKVLDVNANYAEDGPVVEKHRKEAALTFPIYLDPAARLADAIDVRRTSEVALLDDGGRVVYQGAIDDQIAIGIRRPAPTRRDLRDAIGALLSGRAPRVARTTASGCFLSRRSAAAAPAEVTYTGDIAPFLRRHCLACHVPGRVGPMALHTYKAAAAWAETISEVLADRRMPPFEQTVPDPRYGTWKRDGVTDAEREMWRRWRQAGTPLGDPRGDVTAVAADADKEWILGTPSIVLTSAAFHVPATSPEKIGIPYQYEFIYEYTGPDTWVDAVDLRAEAPSVLHHAVLFAAVDDEPLEHWFGFAGGKTYQTMPAGFARRLRHGTRFILQSHYTVDGVAHDTRTRVALRFAATPPTREVRNLMMTSHKIDIPPNSNDTEVRTTYTLKARARVMSINPHMHLRGKDFRLDVRLPDGTARTIIHIPRYQFNWQFPHVAADEIMLPEGTELVATGRYDNTTSNTNNPDPSARVFFGDQTWDEMFAAFVEVAYDEPAGSPRLAEIRKVDRKSYFTDMGFSSRADRDAWNRARNRPSIPNFAGCLNEPDVKACLDAISRGDTSR
jgi:hypothetical protein